MDTKCPDCGPVVDTKCPDCGPVMYTKCSDYGPVVDTDCSDSGPKTEPKNYFALIIISSQSLVIIKLEKDYNAVSAKERNIIFIKRAVAEAAARYVYTSKSYQNSTPLSRLITPHSVWFVREISFTMYRPRPMLLFSPSVKNSSQISPRISSEIFSPSL